MNRVSGICCGDCSKCTLLANGEVDMIPCILDQIFRRVQTNETEIATLKDMIATKKTVDVNVVSNKLRDEDDEI
jgi:hypothetical protein